MVRWAQANTVLAAVLGALAVGVVLVGVAVLGSRSGERTATPAAAPGTTIDERVEQSDWPCEHFRNVAGDVNAGILTDAELREKLKEVNERAVLGTDEVQAAALEMLAASTTGTMVELRAGFVRMDAACTATGH